MKVPMSLKKSWEIYRPRPPLITGTGHRSKPYAAARLANLINLKKSYHDYQPFTILPSPTAELPTSHNSPFT